ncbi:MAG: TetR/AcrR family transcriptional regulator [Oscillospiraceae bacterium]|nr:TetR/AcrR family transcriptional regulator [Oscillospiraceae bacterium]
MKQTASHGKIKETVKNLIFDGKTELTVKQITQEAGISRTSFYANFENLDSVLIELESEFIEDFFILYRQSVQDTACDYGMLTDFMLGNRILLRYFFSTQAYPFFPEKFKRLSFRIQQLLQDTHRLPKSCQDLHSINIILQGSLRLILDCALQNDRDGIQNTLASCDRLICAVCMYESA